MKTKYKSTFVTMTEPDIIGLWVNLSRAFEIAKFGGLSIKLVSAPDYKDVKKDFELIKNFYSEMEFKIDGDLIIEITKPYEYHSSQKRVKAETKEDILKRIEKAQFNKLPTEYSESCETLLRTAANRLEFSVSTCEKVKQIAQIIARLEGTETVQIEHIAEAIQYRAFLDDTLYLDGADNTINFGDGIKISTDYKESTDIEKAIEYLQSLITVTQ